MTQKRVRPGHTPFRVKSNSEWGQSDPIQGNLELESGKVWPIPGLYDSVLDSARSVAKTVSFPDNL